MGLQMGPNSRGKRKGAFANTCVSYTLGQQAQADRSHVGLLFLLSQEAHLQPPSSNTGDLGSADNLNNVTAAFIVHIFVKILIVQSHREYLFFQVTCPESVNGSSISVLPVPRLRDRGHVWQLRVD